MSFLRDTWGVYFAEVRGHFHGTVRVYKEGLERMFGGCKAEGRETETWA